jgi:hypothetical protein
MDRNIAPSGTIVRVIKASALGVSGRLLRDSHTLKRWTATSSACAASHLCSHASRVVSLRWTSRRMRAVWSRFAVPSAASITSKHNPHSLNIDRRKQMKQPLEVIKFSRIYLNAANRTQLGLRRITGHVNRAFGSYKTAPQHPLSDDAARALLEVERSLERLRLALDVASLQVSFDIGYYMGRIQDATPFAQIEIATQETRQ